MRVYAVSCGMYTVEGAAELNLFARGMKERECGFLICLMSHNKERSAWKHRAAKAATQHSYKLRMPCQLSALLTFPPLSFSLVPVKNFQAEKMRRRDAGVDIRQKTGEKKKKREEGGEEE